MGKQIIYIAILFLITTVVTAQNNPLSYKQVDSTTYALYLKQDWKPIIEMGKQSRSEGIDFYYLKVRMGIAYFKENKMLSAIQLLEEAYTINSYDVIVQEYLYWAYIYSGLELESRLFYSKMDKTLKDQIKLIQPLISVINIGALVTTNLDDDAMINGNDFDGADGDRRYFPRDYKLFSFGLNHPLSKSSNFYHQLSVMPSSLVMQEKNIDGDIESIFYNSTEARYYGNITFNLGNRWYLDAYLNAVFGKVDNLESVQQIGNTPSGNLIFASNSATINYSDFVFGGAITKASNYFRNTLNMSVSNLTGLQQFQSGYTVSAYPLGSTFLVPFGSVQYQSQEGTTRMVYSAGISLSVDNFSFMGYVNTGEMYNFVANNGSLIYNQFASTLNETGLILQYLTSKVAIKVGYSYMLMEDNYANDDGLQLAKFQFNQQNIIAGITWRF